MTAALDLLRATLRGSLGLWRSAPWLVLPAVVAQLLQHRAEVNLGMFASREAFAMLAVAPERWWWGGWKLAALGLAVLGGLWLWCRRDGGQVLWQRLGLAALLNAAAMLPGVLVEGRIDPATGMIGSFAVSIALLPLLPFTVAALAGDPDLTLRAAFTRGWWPALRMVTVLVAGYLPLQALHLYNHNLALGREGALLWSLLTWDALVVGMMAAWMATALHHGYRGGAAFAKR